MRFWLVLLGVALNGCVPDAETERIPDSVLQQHKSGDIEVLGPNMHFTFVGHFRGVSEDSYLNVHGEEWGLMFDIDSVVLGSYEEAEISIGTHDPSDPTFVTGVRYYVTVAPGHHGYLLTGYQPVDSVAN